MSTQLRETAKVEEQSLRGLINFVGKRKSKPEKLAKFKSIYLEGNLGRSKSSVNAPCEHHNHDSDSGECDLRDHHSDDHSHHHHKID